jgi:hypothetical protein
MTPGIPRIGLFMTPRVGFCTRDKKNTFWAYIANGIVDFSRFRGRILVTQGRMTMFDWDDDRMYDDDDDDFYGENEDMDGDFDSAMTSAGMGTDEDYGDFGADDLLDWDV